MDLQLNGKTAFVSGSTAGIGHAIADRLAREGARVIINGRTQEGVDKALATLPDGVIGFAGDLTQPEPAERLIAAHPDIDILINNLGIFEPNAFESIPDEDWTRFFEANVLSGVRLSRLVLPHMRSKGWGRIVFISSESGVQIPAEMIHYGMTKTAQLAVARGLAEHLAGTGITVNSVLPGPTRSRGVEQFVQDLAREQNASPAEVEAGFFKEMRPSSLIQRFAETDEVANMVAYVASPLASATTGAALRVDGGVVRSIV